MLSIQSTVYARVRVTKIAGNTLMSNVQLSTSLSPNDIVFKMHNTDNKRFTSGTAWERLQLCEICCIKINHQFISVLYVVSWKYNTDNRGAKCSHARDV